MRKKTQKYEEKENRLDESEDEGEEEGEQEEEEEEEAAEEEEEEEEEGEEGQCKMLNHPDPIAELTRFLSFFLSFFLFSCSVFSIHQIQFLFFSFNMKLSFIAILHIVLCHVVS